MNRSRLTILLLRWLANYGLSLSAADYALPGERGSGCPFAQWLKATGKIA
jgi:hypothetical protein